MALLGFTLPPDSGEKLTLGKSCACGMKFLMKRPSLLLMKFTSTFITFTMYEYDVKLFGSVEEHLLTLNEL